MNNNTKPVPGRLPAVNVSLLAAATTLFAAGLILIGWVFDIGWLRLWQADQVSMKVNTAVAFLISGLLLVVGQWKLTLTAVVTRLVLCGLLMLLVVTTLAQYLFDLQINIDELLFDAPDEALMTSSPGRMAPTTAICFGLFAIAVLLDTKRTRLGRAASRFLATVILLIAVASILGYAFGAPTLYLAIDGVTAMSLPTAILFFTIATGVIWLQPRFGFPAMLTEKTVVGTHARSLLPMVVAAPLFAGAAVMAGYGELYEGRFAIALTSLGSMIAAGIVAAISIIVLRRADEALNLRDRALAATTTGVLITDHRQPDEPIMYVNPALSEITGYSVSEALGRNCRFLNRGVENEPGVLQQIHDCIAGENDGQFELRNRRKDGSEFWNRLSLAPIANYDGTVTHFVGIVHDITERREQELRLEEALENARKASAMRDSFVRLVSHELRTPLNAALTWIRLMEIDDDDATRTKGLKIVAQSILSQSRLIDDLSDVSRVASSGIKLESEKADARVLIEEVIEELRPSIESKLKLVVDAEPGDYDVMVDPLRLKQIVRNLLSNAAKYTDPGGEVSVRLAIEAKEVLLSVTDTGKGLTAEEAAQVFEPFWRADSKQPGLGVGLTIVAALVAAHDGTIDVSSPGPESGTSFNVRLPLNASPDARGPLDVEQDDGQSGKAG
ncbi:MAG: PAS domain S-box protein [Gammaproteobacteria bacterium]|nr:PAS domain S-box protein [Gammaproteobacteria bacterium]